MLKLRGKRSTIFTAILLFVLLLVGVRMYLPYWVKDYVNAEIDKLESYEGGIEDIDLFLWRGAYQIEGLVLHKKDGGIDKPFVAANTIDLSVDWGALLQGAVVAEADLYGTDLNFAKTQTGQGEGWVKFVDALSPFEINRLEVHNGKMTYTDYTAEPNVYLFIENITAKITNLRHVTDKDNALPSTINISGQSIGDGDIRITGGGNILQDIPDFDVSFELKEAQLPAFNSYTRDFASLDFKEGEAGVFGELAIANGRVKGYVKPIVSDVNMVSIDQDQNPFNIIWESLTSFFIEVFENQEADQFAMRIPVEGNIDDPDEDWWSAFKSIFANAFKEAFSKEADGTINFWDALQDNTPESN